MRRRKRGGEKDEERKWSLMGLEYRNLVIVRQRRRRRREKMRRKKNGEELDEARVEECDEG